MGKILNYKKTIGVLILILISLIVYFVTRSTNEIKILKVEKGEMVEATYAVGSVKADKIFNLKTGVNSKMIERFVKVGQVVKKGAPLLKLDSFPTYYAPFEGVVTVLNYEVGELVFAQSTVLTLVNDKDLYLELALDERSLSKIKIGNEAKILFDAQKKTTTGRVRSIFSNADSFYVHLEFDQKNLFLISGMTCDVSIITKKYPEATLVPIEAISQDGKVKKRANPKEEIKLDIILKDSKYAAVKNADLVPGEDLITHIAKSKKGIK